MRHTYRHLHPLTNEPTSVNLLHLTEFKNREKSLKLMVNLTRSKSNQDYTMRLHTYKPLTNVSTKYQLPTPYDFQDIARTRFSNSRSLWQGQRSNQGHTMTLQTYTPQPMSLPHINFLHQRFLRYSVDKFFPATPSRHYE